MARGMAAGEPIVSQAQTKEFDEGYERTFGTDRKAERGRFIYDPKLGKCVPAAEYHASRALDAPVMVGRFYENVCATDGTDIGSRAKREEYMRQNGLSDASDFAEHWKKSSEERANFYQHGFVNSDDQRKNMAAADRALSEIKLMRQRDYNRLQALREKARRDRGRGFEP